MTTTGPTALLPGPIGPVAPVVGGERLEPAQTQNEKEWSA